ncbi:hypothetical protein ACRAWD_04050 [Caulobacter segnis]
MTTGHRQRHPRRWREGDLLTLDTARRWPEDHRLAQRPSRPSAAPTSCAPGGSST